MQKGPFGGHLIVPHNSNQSSANFKFNPTSGTDHIAQGLLHGLNISKDRDAIAL